MGKIAFITDANGITGSAILGYLVQTTNSKQGSKIVMTSRCPFKRATSDPCVEYIALDFSQKPEILAEKMRGVRKEVIYAYFSPYIHVDDFAELNTANRLLFENFLSALLEVPLDLESALSRPEGNTTMSTCTLYRLQLVKKSPVEKPVSTTSTSRRRIFSLQAEGLTLELERHPARGHHRHNK